MNLNINELEIFKEAFSNNTLSSIKGITNKIDNFIINWLNGEFLDRNTMEMLSDIFKEEFLYTGTLYRGITLEENEIEENIFNNNELYSFTNMLEVGKYYANIENDVYGTKSNDKTVQSLLVTIETNNAFSFDEFLIEYSEITDNTTLINEIDNWIWENEKICFYN